jgi:hypothetical protein
MTIKQRGGNLPNPVSSPDAEFFLIMLCAVALFSVGAWAGRLYEQRQSSIRKDAAVNRVSADRVYGRYGHFPVK